MCTRTLKRRCHKANYQYSVIGFFMQKNRERIGKVTEVNKAKEYLLQVSRAEHRIKRLKEEILTLQELVTSTSAISQGERVISSTSQDKMADTICTIEEKIEEWNIEVRTLVEVRAEVMAVISKVSNEVCREILYKRYCQSKKWEEIAIEMDMSYRHTTRLHGMGLQEIEKLMNVSLNVPMNIDYH